MKVVSEIVSACRATVAIKDTEKAYLGPININIGLILGFQDVQNNRNPIFVIVSNDSLVSIGSIRLNDAALLLTCLGWLMVFKLNCLWVQCSRILTKEQSLYFDKLDV